MKPSVMPTKNDSSVHARRNADGHARAIDQAGQHVAPEF